MTSFQNNVRIRTYNIRQYQATIPWEIWHLLTYHITKSYLIARAQLTDAIVEWMGAAAFKTSFVKNTSAL